MITAPIVTALKANAKYVATKVLILHSAYLNFRWNFYSRALDI